MTADEVRALNESTNLAMVRLRSAGWTLKRVGEVFGLSPERVRQRTSMALIRSRRRQREANA